MTRLFSQRGEGCTLKHVRNRSTNWVITALLMFQLAIGLQWQMAQADAVTPDQQMSRTEAGRCPTHQAKISRGNATTSTSSLPSHKSPAPTHDCCHSQGCLCHCAQSSGVLDLARVSAAPSFSLLLPVFDARPPVARTNEFFRPPIA
jgi:hypothetical protein